jgi:hypothetical protein
MVLADFDVEWAEAFAFQLGQVEFVLRLESIFFIDLALWREKQDIDKSLGPETDPVGDLAGTGARKQHEPGQLHRNPDLGRQFRQSKRFDKHVEFLFQEQAGIDRPATEAPR